MIHRLAGAHSPVGQRHFERLRFASDLANSHSPCSQLGGLAFPAFTAGVCLSGMIGRQFRSSQAASIASLCIRGRAWRSRGRSHEPLRRRGGSRRNGPWATRRVRLYALKSEDDHHLEPRRRPRVARPTRSAKARAPRRRARPHRERGRPLSQPGHRHRARRRLRRHQRLSLLRDHRAHGLRRSRGRRADSGCAGRVGHQRVSHIPTRLGELSSELRPEPANALPRLIYVAAAKLAIGE